jgi:Ran-binding protein 1
MKLQPNIGSDRSWVWKVAADYSESPPTSETLAIRFANSESISCLTFYFSSSSHSSLDAQQFKTKFEESQKINASLGSSAAPTEAKETEGATEENSGEKEEEGKEEGSKEEEKKEETPADETSAGEA